MILGIILWSIAVCIIAIVPLYLVVLRPHLRIRSQMRLRERIDELKQRVEIESGLIVYSQDNATRIDCENKLFLFTNELCRLEKKLAKLAKRNKKSKGGVETCQNQNQKTSG